MRALIVHDLGQMFGSINLARPEDAARALRAYVPALVRQYGESAASVAADWYDEVRADAHVRGRFRAQMVVPDETEAVVQTVRRASGALFTDSPGEALVAITAKAGKYALSGARQTIMTSAARDPQASGWERVTRPGACRFCRMLSGRGAVYRESSAHFASHGSCNCAAVPSWDSDAPEVDVRLYEASRRTTGMTPEERARHDALIHRAMDEYVPE